MFGLNLIRKMFKAAIMRWASVVLIVASISVAQAQNGPTGADGGRSLPRSPQAIATMWQEVLHFHSATDFCGLKDWHVRQGYRTLRQKLDQQYPLDFDTAQQIRTAAVSAVESQIVGRGYNNFTAYCANEGQRAARFFIDAWSADQSSRVNDLSDVVEVAEMAAVAQVEPTGSLF